MRPEYPDGWFNSFDFQAYRSMVETLPKGGRMAEIGSFKGRSLSSIANQILERNLRVLAVDPFLEFLLDESAIQQTDSRLTAALTRLGFDIPPLPEPEFRPFPDEVVGVFGDVIEDGMNLFSLVASVALPLPTRVGLNVRIVGACQHGPWSTQSVDVYQLAELGGLDLT